MPKTTFSERIQAAAEKHNVHNPAAFARLIKVTPQTGYKWYMGRSPNIAARDLFKIADVLKVRPRWLLLEQGAQEPGRDLQSDEEWALVQAFRDMRPDQRELVRNLVNHLREKKQGNDKGRL